MKVPSKEHDWVDDDVKAPRALRRSPIHLAKMSRTALAILLLFTLASLAYFIVDTSSGEEIGYIPSGSEGCFCHSSKQDEAVNISMTLPEDGYKKDLTYNLTINVTWNDHDQGGFYLSISNGNLTALDDKVKVEDDRDEATHTEAGAAFRSWTVGWTASDDNETTFTILCNSVDGDGTSKGDAWNSYEIILAKKGDVIVTKPDVPWAFPEYTYNLVLASTIIGLAVATILMFRPVSRGARGEVRP